MGAKGKVYLGGSPWKVGKVPWAIIGPIMGLVLSRGATGPIKPI